MHAYTDLLLQTEDVNDIAVVSVIRPGRQCSYILVSPGFSVYTIHLGMVLEMKLNQCTVLEIS